MSESAEDMILITGDGVRKSVVVRAGGIADIEKNDDAPWLERCTGKAQVTSSG
jgi:hypothetical protein